ncbi:SLAP domain-containing protein [Lactobacillus sp. ESL0681]|uniref:SLAP domain-containing protein n=1 Tax=Lactobacillus sp. ESL0681 TaxID=2983211 RepID=UPI0023F738F2|nr:SLAP domain-containing protein [Lactobacillus sp. ESL0681]WEV40977.1 hypothetical protein OZX59_03405 [Lactobacillus sp. ESL0681]
MKLNKKLLLGAISSVLALGVGLASTQVFNSNTVTAATNTMKLAHGAYVYNKQGKRLKKYRGSKNKTHFHKNTNVKHQGTIKSIERDSKQYYLLDDDNYNQSWLPYKKIKGKYYYNIGHGGYIKAVNVSKINGQPLYVADATVTLKITGPVSKNFSTGTGTSKTKLKNGMKVKIDYICSTLSGNGYENCYHIANTNDAIFSTSLVKNKPHQRLATKTKDTYIKLTPNSSAYNISSLQNSDSITISGPEAVDYIPVIEALYLWVPQDNKTELFYCMANSDDTAFLYRAVEANAFYIKAADTKYISGPQLTPINTPEEAKSDSKIATTSDKQSLQNLIDREAIVKATENYNDAAYYRYKKSYDKYLDYAKKISASKTPTIIEVKQAAWLLNRAQQLIAITKEEANNSMVGVRPVVY